MNQFCTIETLTTFGAVAEKKIMCQILKEKIYALKTAVNIHAFV